jgi:hypothetical protein
MSNYTILRIQKLNDNASIRRSLKHAFREQDTPNADPARLADNSHFFADDVASAMQNIKMRWPDKIRKNGVRLVEFLVTASPDAMNAKTRAEQDAYFADALKYIQDKHGAENVAYAGIHRDETTPHMYIYAVPLDERGKLNCNGFYGKRTSLSDLQTDFTNRVGQPHGFVRGEMRSKAKHTSIKQYYTRVNAVENLTLDSDQITYPPPTLIDKAKTAEYGQKVAESLASQYDERLKNHTVKASKNSAKQEDKLNDLARQVKNMQFKIDNYQTEIQELSRQNGMYRQSLDSKNHALVEALKERDGFQRIAGLFTTDEINRARDRAAKRQEQLQQEAAQREAIARQRREREAAAANQLRLEAEARMAEQERLEAEKIAQQAAAAKAYALQEKNAEAEYRKLREEWRNVDLDRVTRFEFDEKELFDQDENGKWVMSWSKRLEIFKKDGIAVWEALKPTQKPVESEKTIEISRNDYDSPSPF